MSSVFNKIVNAVSGGNSEPESTSNSYNSSDKGVLKERNERTQFGDPGYGSRSNFGSTTTSDRDGDFGSSSFDNSSSSIPSSSSKTITPSSTSDINYDNSNRNDFGTDNSFRSNDRSSFDRDRVDRDRDYSADDAMTRSEEHLMVGKEKVEVGKAELNKYVTTEKVSTAVPIMKEKLVVEREPITEANREAALRGPDFKESHYELNLTEERAVADKMTVPMERVRLRKEPVHTQQYVDAELRKEEIDIIDPTKDAGLGSGTEKTADNWSGADTRSSDSNNWPRDRTDRTIAADDQTSDRRF